MSGGGGTPCGGAGSRMTHTDVVDVCCARRNFSHRGAAVITGATNGIGVASLEALVLAGFDRVFHLARNVRKANAELDRLRLRLGHDLVDARVSVICCALDDLASVRDAAIAVDAQSGPLGVSVLLCNAGIMMVPYAGTRQQIELQFGVNHVAHLFLCEMLIPALRRSGAHTGAASPARVVVVSSVMHTSAASTPSGFRPEQFEFKPEHASQYNRATAYGVAKLANALMALEFDARCQAKGWPIMACSLMPGVIATGLFDDIPCHCCMCFVRPCLKSVEQGAATSIFCCLSPTVINHRGGYFEDCAPARASAKARSLDNAVELTRLTHELIERNFGAARLPVAVVRRRVRRRRQR
jgi:NAD(P)-dependent dehydrogenase (short-subunit alcohol dehydrogenase family)